MVVLPLAIADAGDRILDSDVFLKTGSVKAEPLRPVGGILDLPIDSSDSPARAAEGSGSSAPPYAALVGAAAAAALALVAGGWYARRRLS